MPNEIKQPRIVTLDQTVGLRSWGLILYGALPANLTVIGTLQQNIGKIDNLLYFLLGVSLLPLLLTFLLIRSRHRDWYLTNNRLVFRSVITTLLIVVSASLISGLSGIIHGKYILSTKNFWDSAHAVAIAESFLLGIGSLVISSTLFITFITKNSELPGLPPPKLVESLVTVREKIRDLKASPIWTKYVRLIDDELKEKAEGIKADLEKIFLFTGNKLVKKSLEPVLSGVINFIIAIEEIQKSGNEAAKQINWKIHFAPSSELSPEQVLARSAMQDQYLSVQSLYQLKLGG